MSNHEQFIPDAVSHVSWFHKLRKRTTLLLRRTPLPETIEYAARVKAANKSAKMTRQQIRASLFSNRWKRIKNMDFEGGRPARLILRNMSFKSARLAFRQAREGIKFTQPAP